MEQVNAPFRTPNQVAGFAHRSHGIFVEIHRAENILEEFGHRLSLTGFPSWMHHPAVARKP
ncbi:MAG: hypothetical protein ACLQDV_23545 [Candidatus Binataceae bacterium]